MMTLPAGRTRCIVVAGLATAAAWGAAAALVRAAATTPAVTATGPRADHAITWLCSVTAVVALTWAWLQAVAGVRDAWCGAPATGGVVRRLALAACGAALAGTLASPVSATTAGTDVDRPHPRHVLTGLPLPQRAEGPARPGPGEVVVRAGDTLWAIAARGAGSTDREITERWHHIYAANRGVVGPDPDLIRPGQVLRLTQEER